MNNSLEDDLGKSSVHIKAWYKSRPYVEVREYIKPLKFNTVIEYQNWLRKERTFGRHLDFPMYPQNTYIRKNEWVSVKHFLGKTDNIPSFAQKSIEIEKPPRVGWRIIQQIFGLGKYRQHA